MDNIAEGFERGGNKESINFLRVAKASIGETRSQMRRSQGRGYVEKALCEELASKCEKISFSIGALIRHLNNSDMKGERYVREPEVQYGKEKENYPSENWILNFNP